jgi:cellulose synthase/poly-beta-1,6-N-acetylglucosamine synthase-like glycosyltransferase
MPWGNIWSPAVASKFLLVSASLVIYTWLLYPLLLRLLLLVRPKAQAATRVEGFPTVSIILPVHNEQESIAEKLQNCLELDYPLDRLEIIVVSDASTDRTAEIVEQFASHNPRIRWLESEGRAGKSGVQNLAAAQANGEVLLFSDAGTGMPPGTLAIMTRHLADPGVGLITATVFFGNPQDAVEKGQGFYWRYELFLRHAESDLGILATASGQALLVRRELFRPLPARYGDDCIMPLDIRLQAYRVVQDRDAIVYDTMPHSIEGELRARIRMTARNWTGTLSRPALLNPFLYPLTAWSLVSHKLLRWLTPFFLGVVFLSSASLAARGGSPALFWLQVAFYTSALIGWGLARTHRPAGIFGYPFSFCLANVGFLLGMVKAFRNQKIVFYGPAPSDLCDQNTKTYAR